MALPEETQATLDELFDEFNWRWCNVSDRANAETAKIAADEHGVKWIDLPPEDVAKWEAAMFPIWDTFVDFAVERGADRAEAQKAYDRFLELQTTLFSHPELAPYK